MPSNSGSLNNPFGTPEFACGNIQARIETFGCQCATAFFNKPHNSFARILQPTLSSLATPCYFKVFINHI